MAFEIQRAFSGGTVVIHKPSFFDCMQQKLSLALIMMLEVMKEHGDYKHYFLIFHFGDFHFHTMSKMCVKWIQRNLPQAFISHKCYTEREKQKCHQSWTKFCRVRQRDQKILVAFLKSSQVKKLSFDF